MDSLVVCFFYVVSATLTYGIGSNNPCGILVCIDGVCDFCSLQEQAWFVNSKQREINAVKINMLSAFFFFEATVFLNVLNIVTKVFFLSANVRKQGW